jgi:NADH:ubiquinone oxidoreductase subunit K
MLSIVVADVEAAVGLEMFILNFRNTREVTRDGIARLGETRPDTVGGDL